ncbi:MAG: hypothetical protein QM754_03275 [Tepidisphaeraceae bacterium]
MSTIDLKKQVAAAVSVRWDEFVRRHPNVAAVVDQQMLVDNAAAAIANDAAYQQAMQTAREINAGLDILVGIVDRHVVAIFSRLMRG